MNVVASPIDPYASTGQPGQEWTELWEFNGKLRTAIDEPRESTALFETSAKMLRALSRVLDIREALPQISQSVANVLPHDLLMMTFHDPNGEVVVDVTSGETGMRGARLRCGDPSHLKNDSFVIVEDLDREAVDVGPPDVWDRVRAEGYRSMLVVGLMARDQQLGLSFLSKGHRAFQQGDVTVARFIADHVALAVSHEQLAEAACQVAEARTRAERLEARVKVLAEALESRTHRRIVGQSAEWLGVLKKATQVAATETTVLLSGESGTGKEVVARFIHRASARKSGPFIALNCAALPEQLLESELFGYERGAFTGAQQAKPGQIELAAGGVLFLDEVSEMSRSAQAKFLRVLQEKEFQRLGGTRVQQANVRVIAATNRDILKAVERADFREDLYYRLQVFDITIPPLRERCSDILPLTAAFLDEIGETFGRSPAGLTPHAKEALVRHHWPGNVRELRNALERAVILSEGSLITADHLSLNARKEPSSFGDTLAHATDLGAVERDMIARVLRESRGNKSRAAKRLGLSRTQLYVRLRRFQLDR
jgi:transcriptional regulator with PAS, ATPase and Fis domain